MDYTPILISLKTATVSIIVTFILGIIVARAVASIRHEKIQTVIDGILILPMVLPPTVAGFFLLYIFGIHRPIGSFLIEYFGLTVPFSWGATVLASSVIAFPLMYKSARAAFEQVDRDLVDAAKTIGMSNGLIFRKIVLPLSTPGVAAGGVLSFARGLGEFGATAMIAGNIIGKTRTLPLAVYSAVAGGDFHSAYIYVIILVLIAFVIIVGMNLITQSGRKYLRKEVPSK